MKGIFGAGTEASLTVLYATVVLASWPLGPPKTDTESRQSSAVLSTGNVEGDGKFDRATMELKMYKSNSLRFHMDASRVVPVIVISPSPA